MRDRTVEYELARYKALCEELRAGIITVANSCEFVFPSLPRKFQPGIKAIADELYALAKIKD